MLNSSNEPFSKVGNLGSSSFIKKKSKRISQLDCKNNICNWKLFCKEFILGKMSINNFKNFKETFLWFLKFLWCRLKITKDYIDCSWDKRLKIGVIKLKPLVNLSSLCRGISIKLTSFSSKVSSNWQRLIDGSFWSLKDWYLTEGMSC